MKRGSSWLSEHRNAVAVGILILRGEGVPYTFLRRRHLSQPPSLSQTTRPKKKVVIQCPPSPPQLCFYWISTFNMSLLCALQKQNKTKHTRNGMKKGTAALQRVLVDRKANISIGDNSNI